MKKIYSLVTILFLMVGLFGCGTPKPEPVVEKFCESLKTFDVETIDGLLLEGSTGNSLEDNENLQFDPIVEIITSFNSKIKYNITETVVAEDKESAQVTVEFEYVDAYDAGAEALASIFTEALVYAFSGQEISEEDMLDIMVRAYQAGVQENETAIANATATFELVLSEKEWKIVKVPAEILNVATANFLQPIDDFSEGNE